MLFRSKAVSGSENLEEFQVVEYEVPLISKDHTSSGGTITSEDIKKMPGRSAKSIAEKYGIELEKISERKIYIQNTIDNVKDLLASVDYEQLKISQDAETRNVLKWEE